ncbi:MAG TPA: hypothetical protein VL860_12350, partial [Planctomycetota bacterium]|nr:hypothetical protein [Planctomycetota bacterium]
MFNYLILAAVVFGIFTLVTKQISQMKKTAKPSARPPVKATAARAIGSTVESIQGFVPPEQVPGGPLFHLQGPAPTPEVEEPRPYSKDADRPDASPARLVDAAMHYQDRRDFETALTYWRRLSGTREARKLDAEAWQVRCLFELKRDDEARMIFEAPDVTRAALEVAGEFLAKRGSWEGALATWERLNTGTIEQRAESAYWRVLCLLELGRAQETEKITAGAKAPVDALKAICDFHHLRKQWAEALPHWRKLAMTSMKFGSLARAGQVLCLFEA